ALVGAEHVAHFRHEMKTVGARVLVRHELGEVGAVERPGVDDLLAMGVDDGDGLSGCDEGGLAVASRNLDTRFHGAAHGLKAIKSISTIPPRARSVTPTVVRPGRRLSLKWVEKIAFMAA